MTPTPTAAPDALVEAAASALATALVDSAESISHQSGEGDLVPGVRGYLEEAIKSLVRQRDEAHAALFAIPAGAEGFVLVPKKATRAMADAGYLNVGVDAEPEDVWAAMIAAAPVPPAPSDEGLVKAQEEANAEAAREFWRAESGFDQRDALVTTLETCRRWFQGRIDGKPAEGSTRQMIEAIDAALSTRTGGGAEPDGVRAAADDGLDELRQYAETIDPRAAAYEKGYDDGAEAMRERAAKVADRHAISDERTHVQKAMAARSRQIAAAIRALPSDPATQNEEGE